MTGDLVLRSSISFLVFDRRYAFSILHDFQGGTIGTSLFQRIYRAFMRNDRLSNKESVWNRGKATPSLEMNDFSHPFLLSILTISRNVQFPDEESIISTFNIHDFYQGVRVAKKRRANPYMI